MNQHLDHAPTPCECTGNQAGLSGQQQIRTMLGVLEQSPSTMGRLYAAVETAMQGPRLSTNGKAAIRSYINRNCQKQGFVQAKTRARFPALWSITPKGLSYLYPEVPIPQAHFFFEPLLKALGSLTGHSLVALPRADVMPEVLRQAGYDPKALPKNWMSQASNGQFKIHETLRWVARSIDTLVSTPQRGAWALTPSGLDKAAELNGVVLSPEAKSPVVPVRRATPNATSKWLTKHLAPTPGKADSALMLAMKNALRRNLPLSAKRDLIDDHVQNFILRVVRRDAFAKRLSEGQALPYSKVASYCVNSGRSDARDMGTNPVCREMMGARTDKERQNPASEVALEGFNPQLALENLVASGEAEAGLYFEALWEKVMDSTKKRKKPEAWERYANLLLLKAQGYSTEEIATHENVSRHRAAKMLAQARAMVRGPIQEAQAN